MEKIILISTSVVLIFFVDGFGQKPELVIQNGHNSTITGIATHPTENQMASIDADGKLVMWDMDTRMILKTHQIGNIPYASNNRQFLKYTVNGSNIFFSTHKLNEYRVSGENSMIKTINLENGKTILQNNREIIFGAGADSSLLLTVNEYNDYQGRKIFSRSWFIVQHRDTTKGQQTISFDQKITTIRSISAEKKVVIGFFDGSVKSIDTDLMKVMWETTDFGGPITSIDYNERYNLIAYTGMKKTSNINQAGYLLLRKLEHGTLVHEMEYKSKSGQTESSGITKAIFSSDGRYLVGISYFKLLIWNIPNGKLIYDDEPGIYFSVNEQMGRIMDVVSLPDSDSDDVILAAGNNLFSFDLKTKAYSGNFNQGLNQNRETMNYGTLDNNRYYRYDINNSKLDFINLSTFESTSHSFSSWESLFLKANTDTSRSVEFEFLPWMHPGNSMIYMPHQNNVALWSSLRNNTDYYKNNYFLQFDATDWSYIQSFGPFSWEKDFIDYYSNLEYLNTEKGWYLLRSPSSWRPFETNYGYDIAILDLKSNHIMLETTILDGGYKNYKISPKGKYLSFIDTTSHLRVYNTTSFKKVSQTDIETDGPIISPTFTENHELFFAEIDSLLTTRITRVDLKTGKKELFKKFTNVLTAMKAHDKYLALSVDFNTTTGVWQDSVEYKMKKYGYEYFLDPHVLVLERSTGKTKVFSEIKNLEQSIQNISLNENMILVKPIVGPLHIFNLDNPDYGIKHWRYNDFNIFSDTTYYKAPKEALETLGLKVGYHAYPVENFDILYNRPDILMQNLGFADETTVKLYHDAWLKRLSRNGVKPGASEQMFKLEHMPKITLQNAAEISAVTDKPEVNIKVILKDQYAGLSHWNITVNGVPVFVNGKKKVVSEPGELISDSASVELMEGENRIKIIAHNRKGLKSIPIQRVIKLETDRPVKPDVYVVSLGVSDYKHDQYNLRYAAKDAEDIQKLFNPVNTSFGTDFKKINFPGELFGDIHHLLLKNNQVTRNAFLALKDSLKKSKPDDMILVFLAGHGVLDDKGTYYFAAHDMNFHNPSERGISFSDIQSIFDGIPARKRVLFMDTCHSGELDTESNTLFSDSSATINQYGNTRLVSNLKRGVKTLGANPVSHKEDEFNLMKKLFADFNSTGTVIISAASGTGYALEDDSWRNGVFTYSLIKGLKEYLADQNSDRRITVSELKDYVLNKVVVLTGGKQRPTTRQENLEFDFRIW